MSIKKVRIENYRGLEALEFEPSRINVFVGRNNTGKSSALEAIALTLSAKNGFVDALEEDLIERLMQRRLPKTWMKGFAMQRYFIKLGSEEGHVSVDVDGHVLQLDLQFFEAGVPESEAGDKFIEFLENYSREKAMETSRFVKIINHLLREEREKPRQLTLSGTMADRQKEEKTITEIIENKKKDIIKEMLMPPKLFIIGTSDSKMISVFTYVVKFLQNKEEAESYKVFFEHNEEIPLTIKMSSLNEAEEVKELLGALFRRNKHEEALEFIRKEVEYFKDLREVGGELLCGLTIGTVPLSFMGDGFLALLDITFMTTLAEGGAVFIEEPETCLHPGFLDVAARQIVNSAERTQFFISTHNAELLEYLLEAGKDHLALFRFVRLYRMPDGELSYDVLTGKEAAEEIFEIKSDLRGI